jgi:acetyl-CoA decarbonylase/synthase complex subunit gamma
VQAALREVNLAQKVRHRTLIIPGLAAPLSESLAENTGWHIDVGPICALELPLYFGEYWQPPGGDGNNN